MSKLGLLRKIMLVVLFSLIYFVGIEKFVVLYTADVNYKNSQVLLAQAAFPEALEKATLAISKNPLEPLYYRGRAKVYITAAFFQNESNKKILKELALSDLQVAYNLNPRNLATIRNAVPLYYKLALAELSGETFDNYYLEKTKEYFAQIKNISPNDVGIYTLLAEYEKKLQLDGEYATSVEKIKELRPDLLDWYLPSK